MAEFRVLIVDDEAELRRALAQSLDLAGYQVDVFESAEDVLDVVQRDLYGVIVSDIRMGGMDGLTLMKRILDVDPAIPVVLITAHGDVPLAVEAMRSGAYDFIEKPFPTAKLVNVVSHALEKRRLTLENRALRAELADRKSLEAKLVGRSAAIDRLRRQVIAIAMTDADVLVLGETGAGKEVIARALHEEGPRSSGRFVALNCGALPAELIESELFGHEAGAFTGAVKRRIGKLEYASGGTIFLDEIESMPLELQVKLLRVIEGRVITRVGSNEELPLDVRFVAATKVDLEALSAAGKFRRDLFFRLNVVSLSIPPLRQRKEDIPLLFHHLAREARARYRREIPPVTPEILVRLAAQDWPGNVRELRNAADRFVLGLWDETPDEGAPVEGDADGATGALGERMAAFERSLILAELQRNQGSLKATYEALGLSRKALYEKMKRHRLDKTMAIDEG